MELCELCLWRWLDGRKTYTLLWSLHARRCPNSILKLLLQRVWFLIQNTSSIHSSSCDCLGSGGREWLLILRMRLLIQPDTRRQYWSLWRMNTVPNIDVCTSLNPKEYCATIFSLPQWLQDLVIIMMHMIFSTMITAAECLKMWHRRCPDQSIMQHPYWLMAGSVWIHSQKYHTTLGKLIRIIMITSTTLWM